MFRRTPVLWILVLTVAACTNAGEAEDATQNDDRFPLPHLKEFLPEFGRVVFLLGESRIEEATEQLGHHICRGPKQLTQDNGEWSESMRREFRVFQTVSREFESVDYVGLKPVSSQSCTIVFMSKLVEAHGLGDEAASAGLICQIYVCLAATGS